MVITNKFEKFRDKNKGYKHIGILSNGIVGALRDGIFCFIYPGFDWNFMVFIKKYLLWIFFS